MGTMAPIIDQFEDAPHKGKNFGRMHFTLTQAASKEIFDYLAY